MIVALSAGDLQVLRAEMGVGGGGAEGDGKREGNPYMLSESNLLFSKLRKCS